MSEMDQTPITLQWAHILAVLPLSIVITVILMKLSNTVSKDFIFLSVTISFTAFFLIHAFYLFPYRATLHHHFQRIHWYIHENYDEGTVARLLLPLCGVICYPFNALLFVVADLWGTISISVLVFGFVNDVTSRQDAKRYYTAIGILSQAGSLGAGSFVSSMMSQSRGTHDMNQFLKSYQFLTVVAVMTMYLMMFVYFITRFHLIHLPSFHISEAQLRGLSQIRTKQMHSIRDSLRFAFSHRYILSLAGILIGYNWLNAIFEHLVKDLLHLYFAGCQSGYAEYRALLTTFTSGLTFFAMMFGGHNALRVLGWKVTALLCPTVLIFGPLIFYIYGVGHQQYKEDEETGVLLRQLPACAVMLYIGAVVLTLEKTLKYSCCDPTKEIGYLYLSPEAKYKGKIAVEMLGSKFGKFFGATFNIFVSTMNPRSFFKSSEYLALGGTVIGGIIWLSSIGYLDKEMKLKSQEQEKEHDVIAGDSGSRISSDGKHGDMNTFGNTVDIQVENGGENDTTSPSSPRSEAGN